VLSFYHPGNSPLHRLNAGVKLGILALTTVVVMFLTHHMILVGILGVVVMCYGVARIPVGTMWRLGRMGFLLVVIIAGFQWLFTTWESALLVGLRILIVIVGANLLTLTTSTENLVTVVERILSPLRRFGVHPERVGIAVSLTLRFTPVIQEQTHHIRQAQKARGVKAPWTFLVPLVIRSLRMADTVGEALEVRVGLGDHSSPDLPQPINH
jgi:biotin transport system permease protein